MLLDPRHTLSRSQKEFVVGSIDDGPGAVAKDAVSNYIGAVQLHPVTDTGQTLVVWTSSYDSDDSEAVGELCNPIYRALLAQLKAHLTA